jgi:hypothetical protein
MPRARAKQTAFTPAYKVYAGELKAESGRMPPASRNSSPQWDCNDFAAPLAEEATCELASRP